MLSLSFKSEFDAQFVASNIWDSRWMLVETNTHEIREIHWTESSFLTAVRDVINYGYEWQFRSVFLAVMCFRCEEACQYCKICHIVGRAETNISLTVDQ